MPRIAAYLGIFLALGWLCPPAAGQVPMLLHSQPPNRLFGYTSDTAARDNFGNPSGQLVADRFVLAQGGGVCKTIWWGFYGSDFDQVPEPAPQNESFMVRLYQESAGLPGALLWERIFDDPSRVATGRYIATGAGPPEYRYEISWPDCFEAQPGVNYWVTVAQLNLLSSRFRWETATGGEFALEFPLSSPWRVISGFGQLAYELWTPEPASFSSLALGLCGIRLGRYRRDWLRNKRVSRAARPVHKSRFLWRYHHVGAASGIVSWRFRNRYRSRVRPFVNNGDPR
jgi:hypothetical protein